MPSFNGSGAGPVYGHAASKDLAHWARLPVAIWNDRPYDSVAIYTGSATVVDGKIYQLYPGICKPVGGPHGAYSNCTTGGNLNLAVPADPSDPLLTNWSKLDTNPVVNNTQRDPSSAWRTVHGEWRIVTYNTTLYGSTDFHSWYEVGHQPGFDVGECPSFMPLPRDTPGSGPVPSSIAGKPTHVYKNSHSWADFMQVCDSDGPSTRGKTCIAHPHSLWLSFHSYPCSDAPSM